MKPISPEALDQIFLKARTQKGWLDRPVPDEVLQQIYEIASQGPTSMNTQPMRVLFLRTPAAKARLLPMLAASNVDKVTAAPVCAIIARDTRFHEYLPQVWHNPAAAETFAANPALAKETAQRNATLQGAYLIIAARALGLDCGPMSGFDIARVNAEFFPDGRYEADFICSIGYGDPSKLMAKQPRHPFQRACQFL